MVAARGLIQHGVGNIHVDEKIAFGYLQVNTGNFAAGIKLFSELLQSNPKARSGHSVFCESCRKRHVFFFFLRRVGGLTMAR